MEDEITGEDLAAIVTPTKKEKTEEKVLQENERLKAKAYELEHRNIALEKQLEYARAEKRKPGLTVVNEDGETEKKKRPNSLGISDLMLPPYTKKQIAIYRVLGAESINEATGLKVDPIDTLIPGEYILYDRFEKDPLKKNKTIANITTTEKYKEDNEIKVRDVIEDVIFHRGFLQVSVEEQYNLYCFMELNSFNIDNKFRKKNAMRVFERMDIKKKSSAVTGAELDLAIDAANLIRLMQKDEILAYCHSIPELHHQTSATPIHGLRTDLIRYAMNSPLAFYKLNKNAKAAIQINLVDALNFGLIEYKSDVKSYFLSETEERLHTHTASEEPMQAFVKYLAKTENAEIYKIITDRLNYWSND